MHEFRKWVSHGPFATQLAVSMDVDAMPGGKRPSAMLSKKLLGSFSLVTSRLVDAAGRVRRAVRHRTELRERFIRRERYRQAQQDAIAEAVLPVVTQCSVVSWIEDAHDAGLHEFFAQPVRHEQNWPAASQDAALS